MLTSILSDCGLNEDNFCFERILYKKGFLRVAGTDEVGRGPLAGPVLAACVVLPSDCNHKIFVDSKKISHKKRLELNQYLLAVGASVGIGLVSEKTIDEINILQASLLAMKLAVENVDLPCPDFILVDGKFTIPMSLPQEALIKGESRSASVAAASIAAKVARDEIMTNLHDCYPDYNFIKNKGYPTKEHRDALARLGPTPCHRQTFNGVRQYGK